MTKHFPSISTTKTLKFQVKCWKNSKRGIVILVRWSRYLHKVIWEHYTSKDRYRPPQQLELQTGVSFWSPLDILLSNWSPIGRLLTALLTADTWAKNETTYHEHSFAHSRNFARVAYSERLQHQQCRVLNIVNPLSAVARVLSCLC